MKKPHTEVSPSFRQVIFFLAAMLSRVLIVSTLSGFMLITGPSMTYDGMSSL